MSRKGDIPVIDFDDPAMRKHAKRMIDALRGRYWFNVTRCRSQRTLKQNAWYWGFVLPAVSSGMGEVWGQRVSSEEVHEFLKDRFLKRPFKDRRDGKTMGYTVRSTPSLNTEEFGQYLDQIIVFAADYLGVEIPVPHRMEAIA